MVRLTRKRGRGQTAAVIRLLLKCSMSPRLLATAALLPLFAGRRPRHGPRDRSDANALPTGIHAFNAFYPLHASSVGGWLYDWVTALSGLAMAGIGVVGSLGLPDEAAQPVWAVSIEPLTSARPPPDAASPLAGLPALTAPDGRAHPKRQ